MARCSVWEAALKVREDHERLRLDALLLDVFKAWAEAGPAAAHWFKRNRLSLVKDSGVMNLGVEIEDMNPLGPPLRDDGVQFVLEKSELPAVDRAGAVHADYNFTHTILANAWQV
jgi:hypothetical protein